MSRLQSRSLLGSVKFSLSLSCLLLALALVACGPQAELPLCQKDSDCSSGQSCDAGTSKCVQQDPASITTPLTYKIKEQCSEVPMENQDGWAKIDIKTEGGKLVIAQQLVTHCAAKLDFKLEKDGNTLKIIETNEGQLTRCTCGYALDMQIGNLAAGTYNVEVWGVKNSASEGNKLGSKEITLP